MVHLQLSQVANNTKKAGSSLANCDLVSARNNNIVKFIRYRRLFIRFLYWKFLYTFCGAINKYNICQKANSKSIWSNFKILLKYLNLLVAADMQSLE